MIPGGMMGPGVGVAMMLFWLVLTSLAAAAIVLSVFHLSNRGVRQREPGGNDEAMDMARRRFAGGEIGRSEFDAIEKTLTEEKRQKRPQSISDVDEHDRA